MNILYKQSLFALDSFVFSKALQYIAKVFHLLGSYLTIIARARMGSESIAHEAEGGMGY